MNKISQIIFKILIIILLVIVIKEPTCQASQASFWGDIFDAGDNFVEQGKSEATTGSENEKMSWGNVQIEFNKIYNILFSLGVVLTVIIGVVLGIKFLFGSVEEQAKVKETLFPYFTGCIVIFGAFGIWKLLVTLLSSI